ncbi:SCO family protein [Streptacidiphilus carbonis]|uniref:SCO family protein n=1 Tax=Streptacidiphilus carbonis TaxID=105422 RepID=UPI0006937632|nr:SCO family protein [Streptacidiphilus carbonis]
MAPATARIREGLALVAGCALLTACASAGPPTIRQGTTGEGLVTVATAPAAPSAAWPYYGIRIEPAVALPTFELTDTTGAPYRPSTRAAGRIVTLFFGYTACPDECPTTMADIAAALRELPASVRDRVTTLFVTLDPAHDTAGVLRGWLAHFDPGFVGLSGPVAEVDRDALALGVPAQPPSEDAAGTRTVEHGTQTLVFGRDGTAQFVWSPETTVSDIAHDLKQLADVSAR